MKQYVSILFAMLIQVLAFQFANASTSLKDVEITEFLGNDRRLNKPIFVLEGFDPTNEYDNQYMYDALPYNLKDLAYNSGRDIIMVNFKEGGAKIEDNAMAFQNVIRHYRIKKRITYPYAVVGFSMGGLVARWALRNMELRGENHNTSLFLSYDSPQYGANIPIDIYNALKAPKSLVKKVSLGSYSSKALKRAIRMFEAPAARQLLVWGSMHKDFFQKLERMGMPKKPYNIGLASGSGYGRTQGVRYGHLHLDFKVRVSNGIWNNSKRRKIQSRKLGDCSFPCNPIFSFYDNAPGSTLDAISTLQWYLKDAASSSSKF